MTKSEWPRVYYPLDLAAKKMNCSTEDILHLGPQIDWKYAHILKVWNCLPMVLTLMLLLMKMTNMC